MLFKKRGSSLEVIIGHGSSLKGDLSTEGVVRLDGSMEGNLRADWLIMGETGVMVGDVTARGAVIDGRMEGTIRSSDTVEIKSRGIVKGAIFTSKLIVSSGAFFEGRSHMDRTEDSERMDVLSIEQRAK